MHQGGSLRLMEKRKQLEEGSVNINQVSPYDLFAIYDPHETDLSTLMSKITNQDVKKEYVNYLTTFHSDDTDISNFINEKFS